MYTLVLKELHPHTVLQSGHNLYCRNPFPVEEPFRITLHLHYFHFAFPVDQTGGNPCQGTLFFTCSLRFALQYLTTAGVLSPKRLLSGTLNTSQPAGLKDLVSCYLNPLAPFW